MLHIPAEWEHLVGSLRQRTLASLFHAQEGKAAYGLSQNFMETVAGSYHSDGSRLSRVGSGLSIVPFSSNLVDETDRLSRP